MGTTWSVRFVPPPGLHAEAALEAVETELAEANARFSHWDPRSELARFNGAPPGFYKVSDPFWSLLNTALDLADDTNGAVDPTLGALVDLWGFGPPGPRPAGDFPSDEEIAHALECSGWRGLRLNRPAQAVQQIGGLRLDLSGIAKGHTVDRVSDRLTELGCAHHLVEIGGELRGRGMKPDGEPWWVDLQQAPGAPATRTLVALFDLAVATSGDWIRGFDHEGRRYAHTLDGRTGRPLDNGVASVSVLADTALHADAMATALAVMGPVEGPAFADALDLAASFVVRGPDGLIETVTAAFQAMLEEAA